MTITKTKWGLSYLALGVFVATGFAALGGANTQDASFSALMAWLALVSYVAVFELSSVINASAKPAVIAAGGLGVAVCMWMIGATTSAINHGTAFSLLPQAQGRLWWVIPLAIAIWTAREIYRRKRQGAGL